MYEMRPDIFPHGWLTPDELELWELYYQDKEESRKKN